MRIGVNAHLLPKGDTYRSAGVARYETELFARLPEVAPQHEFIFFAPPGTTGQSVVDSHFPTANPAVRIAWEVLAGPIEARRRRLDLFHGPVNVGIGPSRVPTVITLHDLAFVKYPDLFSAPKAAYLQRATARAVHKAVHVITPSRSTRVDAIEKYRLDDAKVTVVPLGVDPQFTKIDTISSPLDIPFILFVGTIEPRKNLSMLLRAFVRLKGLGYPHKLVIIGPEGWKFAPVHDAIDQLSIRDAVVMPGFVDDLVPWYNSAALFVFPSLYEGFGLPPLEAMACGTPVIVSSAGSLREVVDDAALVVSPNDEAGLVESMIRILDDASLAEHLSTVGIARAALFSWDKTVRETVRIYEAALRDVRD